MRFLRKNGTFNEVLILFEERATNYTNFHELIVHANFFWFYGSSKLQFIISRFYRGISL